MSGQGSSIQFLTQEIYSTQQIKNVDYIKQYIIYIQRDYKENLMRNQLMLKHILKQSKLKGKFTDTLQYSLTFRFYRLKFFNNDTEKEDMQIKCQTYLVLSKIKSGMVRREYFL